MHVPVPSHLHEPPVHPVDPLHPVSVWPDAMFDCEHVPDPEQAGVLQTGSAHAVIVGLNSLHPSPFVSEQV